MHKRRQQITELVNTRGRIELQQLATHFNVSVQTIRTDVRVLAQQGLILRNHGEVLPFPHRENISYDQRRIRNAGGKRRIGSLCAQWLNGYQTLFLGTGSTVAELSAQLGALKGLQILTNNLHAARLLCGHPDCALTIAGGRVRQRDQDVIGGDALRFFQRYQADIAITSVGAMDDGGRLYDYNDDEVMAREAMLEQSRFHILLIDSSKFGTHAPCSAGRLEQYDLVVSDTPLPPRLHAGLKASGRNTLC
ncbi:Glycerol-3-phosphate regulon repressor, DeoR family [Marinobacterium lacunae]|uniref:Glycerol-3-phosphate regulon repressor, DeoR family n=1 Tax=Marinobacterium lacunae TaxID=1232683 RepID=A0A081G1X9_9GAMM|nr:DeoR/GlpR family DNA-binding transcription regulator [Marinobacterium lacunae]KEA64784.1 Glycerol-3-phosphate regulon repressor, DeoR family [Marinobacterium lacunae]